MSKYYHNLGHEHFFPTSDELQCSQIVLPLYSVEYVPGSAVKLSVNKSFFWLHAMLSRASWHMICGRYLGDPYLSWRRQEDCSLSLIF